jgi:CRP-like cAMP-binding protein
MLFIIRGEVGIYKRNPVNEQQYLTTVTSGMTLGEMSMVDGKPRFATCIALQETTFGVLMRDGMLRIILENPGLGTKILLKVGTLLSQRLRQTSARLLQYMSSR